MSAVHGPMPLMVTSCACAASAGIPAKPVQRHGSGRRRLARRRAACGSSAPRARSRAGPRRSPPARRSAATSTKRSLTRRQIAAALAVESCCATTMPARPSKPGSRLRKGGRPATSNSGPHLRVEPQQFGQRVIQRGIAVDHHGVRSRGWPVAFGRLPGARQLCVCGAARRGSARVCRAGRTDRRGQRPDERCNPSSASPRARTASCISAMPCPRC